MKKPESCEAGAGAVVALAGQRIAHKQKMAGRMEQYRHVPAPATIDQWLARWREIFENYHSKLHRRVWRALGADAAPALVDSTVQEAFNEYQAWEHTFGTTAGQVPEDAWGPLVKRATNRVLDWRRRHAKLNPFDGDDGGAPLLATDSSEDHDNFWVRHLFVKFANVHPECAEVLADYYVEDWTLEEVGRRFCHEPPEPTPSDNTLIMRAKRLVKRAKKEFAAFVGERG